MSVSLYRQIDELRSASTLDASHQCEQLFGPALQRIVRRVIRTGRTRDRLTESIIQQVREVRNCDPDLHRDDMVNEVARRLCARLAGQNCDWRGHTVTGCGVSTVTPG